MKRVLLVLACLSIAVAAQARTRSENIYKLGEAETVKVGPHVIYLSGGDIDTEGFRGLGAQFIYQYSKFFALEGSISTYKDSVKVSNSTTGHTLDGRIERDTLAFQATARPELPLADRFGLYAGGGIGFYSEGIDDSLQTTTSTDFTDFGSTTTDSADGEDAWGYHVLVGVQCVVLDNTELFGEYRWQVVDSSIDVESEVRSVEGELEAGTSSTIDGFDHGMFRIGLNFYF